MSPLKQLLNVLSINPRIITTIADYEAFSETTVRRMNVTKNEFIGRVNLSRITFEKSFNEVLPTKTFMFTDLCGGETIWTAKINEVMNKFTQSEFGFSDVNTNIFHTIAEHRQALYKNWFSCDGSIEKYVPIAMNQAAEYVAIGYYINNLFENCLILGADSVDFAQFYSYYKLVPALYFKRFYC